MDAGPLDVLQQTRDQDRVAVGDRVDIYFDAFEIAVDPNRAVWVDVGRASQLLDQIGRGVAEVDGEATDDERRPNDDRIADTIGQRQRLLDRAGHAALRLRDADRLDQVGEADAVLGLIDGLEVCAQQRDAGSGQ